MATTIATLTLTSADIKSDALSLTKSATLYKADSTTGLDETTGLNKVIYASTANVLLLDSTVLGVGKAAKVYIANKSTDASEYVDVQIHDQNVGRLYAGDWMFIPWTQSDPDGNIRIKPSVATALPVEYMMIHEGATQTAAA
jgi:hypothetical protein|tara:strand:- start:490 stop:915 length:426 start_codon:yes stop_codon:yes gene_type:complete